jgi:hypothetical protein
MENRDFIARRKANNALNKTEDNEIKINEIKNKIENINIENEIIKYIKKISSLDYIYEEHFKKIEEDKKDRIIIFNMNNVPPSERNILIYSLVNIEAGEKDNIYYIVDKNMDASMKIKSGWKIYNIEYNHVSQFINKYESQI